MMPFDKVKDVDKIPVFIGFSAILYWALWQDYTREVGGIEPLLLSFQNLVQPTPSQNISLKMEPIAWQQLLSRTKSSIR
jgi:hypothetical protein